MEITTSIIMNSNDRNSHNMANRKALGRRPNAHAFCTATIGIVGTTGKEYVAVTANIELG
jgi:hypothetical protein